ncbi:MAG: VUT family protein [Christensenella sp.]|nr:MAG: VUT family protein [Christensenella sp.]
MGSVIPGTWGESYVEGSQGVINSALDNTFGGTWYVLLGSTVAFVASAFVNNFINWSIGKALKDKKDNFFAFALRTYVSTAVGQFVDNLIFAFIVSLNFFGWSPLQCVTCALTGMVAELLFEVVFSHLGYLICKKWKKDNVGEAYFALRAQKEQTV